MVLSSSFNTYLTGENICSLLKMVVKFLEFKKNKKNRLGFILYSKILSVLKIVMKNNKKKLTRIYLHFIVEPIEISFNCSGKYHSSFVIWSVFDFMIQCYTNKGFHKR